MISAASAKKKKIRKSLPIISGSGGGRLKKYGLGAAAWGRMFQRVGLLVRPCQKVMPFAI